MLATDSREQGGLFTKLMSWWREVRRRRAAIGDNDQPGAGAERGEGDIGRSGPELRIIAAKRPNAADLLRPRLVALGIERAGMLRKRPEVMRALERVCTVCGDKSRCEYDLAKNSADPRWREYCPNVHTFDALKHPSRGTSPPAAREADRGASDSGSPGPALSRGFPVQRGK